MPAPKITINKKDTKKFDISEGSIRERFRPSLRQYRILEAANKELKELKDIATNGLHERFLQYLISDSEVKFLKKQLTQSRRLNWYMIAWQFAILIAIIIHRGL